MEHCIETDLVSPGDSVTGSPTDEELVCRAQRGDISSFEEVMYRYEGRLLRFLRQRGASADAEDLAQDTFVRVYVNLHCYQPRWRFSTWLFTIARRLSINHHAQFKVNADSAALQWAASPKPGPARLAADADHRQHLWSVAVSVLSEEEMTAMWLYYVEDVPPREIGAILGRSWLAVKSIMYRARRKLAPSLTEAE